MSKRVLRWGLLGTGNITKAVIPPLLSSERNKLISVSSRSLQRAETFAHDQGLPVAFGSYEELLASPEIDVVYISLPNTLHAEWTIKAVRAGKHVLCEKPLAVTVEEVDAVGAEARQAGVVVAEAFMYRHIPQTLKARELVENDAIGDLRLIRGSFSYPLDQKVNIRLDRDLAGGSLWDVGCYPISLERYIVGQEPLEVMGWQVLGPSGVDETFVGQMRFPGGVFAQFDCSFRAPYRTEVEIVGDKGTICILDAFKPGFGLKPEIVVRRGAGVESLTVPAPHLYLGEIEDMADAVLLGKTPRIGLAETRGNIAVITALLRSAQEGLPVAIA